MVEVGDDVFLSLPGKYPGCDVGVAQGGQTLQAGDDRRRGNIRATLAWNLEGLYQVKLIEQSYERCRLLSERLKHALILNGSATVPQLLTAENIEVYRRVLRPDQQR